MELIFKVDIPARFSEKEKREFLKLLVKQGQVQFPDLAKVNSSKFLCLVRLDGKAIAIGAIKRVSKISFDHAQVPALRSKYNFELGYLFVGDKEQLRGSGIGKMISKLLLNALGEKNVFATTDIQNENVMRHILEKLGFRKKGKSYRGRKTGKPVGLFVRTIR